MLRHGSVALAGAVLAAASSGCAYLQHRLDDALEMVDVGLTVSAEPQLALYADEFSLLPVGYADVEDAGFIGIGGGAAGVSQHDIYAYGLFIFGEEWLWWDHSGTETGGEYIQGAGVIGVPFSIAFCEVPGYAPASIHYIHLGWVGAAVNIRWIEIADFLLGWTTLDIIKDDGKPTGEYPWESVGISLSH